MCRKKSEQNKGAGHKFSSQEIYKIHGNPETDRKCLGNLQIQRFAAPNIEQNVDKGEFYKKNREQNRGTGHKFSCKEIYRIHGSSEKGANFAPKGFDPEVKHDKYFQTNVYNPDGTRNLDEEEVEKQIESTMEIPDEYWRPSYMFHWLKHIGGKIEDAYHHFEDYKGMLSYQELNLDVPNPLPRDDDDEGSEWSHMSDYDESGSSPIGDEDPDVQATRAVNAECIVKFETMIANDECSNTELEKDVDVKEQPYCREHCEDSGTRIIEFYVEIGKTQECDRQYGEATRQQHQGDNRQAHENEHDETSICTTTTRQVDDHDVGGGEGKEPVMKDHETEELSQWIDCMMRGHKRGGQGNKEQENEDEDGNDGSQQLCPMTGESWEQLPFPIIVESGACASVMPFNWCTHVPLRPTPQSEANEYVKAANGQKIYNDGQRMVTSMTKEGTNRDMNFTVCEVSKALGSVSQMRRAGHRVVFNPPGDPNGSYVEHIEIGDIMWLEEQAGL